MVDLERWPLVVAQPPATRGEDSAALEEFYRGLEQVLSRRRPFVIVFDLRGVKTLSNCRKRLVEWTNVHDSSIRAYMIALAVVVESEVERADVTTTFWNLNQSYHARIFDDSSEAENWLLAEFARGEGAN
jgi:hypothetical protein